MTDMTATKIVRIQGVRVRVPRAELTDALSFWGDPCDATEPEWPDGSGGEVVCTLPPHPAGASGIAHIANNADAVGADIIAIWWDEPATADAESDWED